MTEIAPSRDQIARAVARAEAKVVNQYNASFAGCSIDGPVFRVGKKSYLVNTVTVEMELGAQTTSSRTTVTRVVAGTMIAGVGGALVGGAAKKSKDTSKIYLTVRTPDGQVHVKEAPTSMERVARDFMAKLEMASKRTWPLTSEAGTTLPLAESSVRKNPPSTALGHVLIGLMLIGAALTVHWAFWLALVAYIVVVAVVATKNDDKYKKALEEFRKGATR